MDHRSPVNSFMNNKNTEVTPVQALLNHVNEKSACFSPLQILETKLLDYGLVPVEVGGQGNCFFHVISHQLFDDPKHHFYIRAAGVNYLRQNPERFIDQSWLEYLENMSRQGTWADNLIIQAVADALNLKIIIIESDPTFADVNAIAHKSSNPQQEPQITNPQQEPQILSKSVLWCTLDILVKCITYVN